MQNGQYLITGEKTLVILAETADLFLVSAELNGQADVFIVQRDASIQFKAAPAMGLKACETATLKFNQTPAERLGTDDFDYSAFLRFRQSHVVRHGSWLL